MVRRCDWYHEKGKWLYTAIKLVFCPRAVVESVADRTLRYARAIAAGEVHGRAGGQTYGRPKTKELVFQSRHLDSLSHCAFFRNSRENAYSPFIVAVSSMSRRKNDRVVETSCQRRKNDHRTDGWLRMHDYVTYVQYDFYELQRAYRKTHLKRS